MTTTMTETEQTPSATRYTIPGFTDENGVPVQMDATQLAAVAQMPQFATAAAIALAQAQADADAAPAPMPVPVVPTLAPTPDASFAPYTPGVTPAIPGMPGTIPDPNTMTMPDGFDDEFEDEFNAEYEAAPASAGRSFEDLPAGKYIAYVRQATGGVFEQGDNAGKRWVSLTFRVMDGPHRGCSQNKFYRFAGATREAIQKQVGFFKTDMATMGVDLAAIGMTPAQLVVNGLHELRNRVMAVHVVYTTKEGVEYANLYIDRVVNGKPIDEELQAMDTANQWAPAGGVSGGNAGAGGATGRFTGAPFATPTIKTMGSLPSL